MAKNAIIIAGVIIGVLAIAGIEVYATINQENFLLPDAVPAPANIEGSFSSPSGLGAELNKEKWHADPFGDMAAEVKAKFESGG